MITLRAEMLARLLAATRPLDDYQSYLAVVFECFADLDDDARLGAVLRAERILRDAAPPFDPDFAKRCNAHADALVRKFQNHLARGRRP